MNWLAGRSRSPGSRRLSSTPSGTAPSPQRRQSIRGAPPRRPIGATSSRRTFGILPPPRTQDRRSSSAAGCWPPPAETRSSHVPAGTSAARGPSASAVSPTPWVSAPHAGTGHSYSPANTGGQSTDSGLSGVSVRFCPLPESTRGALERGAGRGDAYGCSVVAVGVERWVQVDQIDRCGWRPRRMSRLSPVQTVRSAKLFMVRVPLTRTAR